jgi:hypothetical protein
MSRTFLPPSVVPKGETVTFQIDHVSVPKATYLKRLSALTVLEDCAIADLVGGKSVTTCLAVEAGPFRFFSVQRRSDGKPKLTFAITPSADHGTPAAAVLTAEAKLAAGDADGAKQALADVAFDRLGLAFRRLTTERLEKAANARPSAERAAARAVAAVARGRRLCGRGYDDPTAVKDLDCTPRAGAPCLDGEDVLAAFTGLSSVRFVRCRIEPSQKLWEALAALPALTSLRLEDVTGVQPAEIGRLTKLTDLSLDKSRVKDASPLASLTALTMLSLNDNELKDATPLGGLRKLTVLYVARNKLTDVAPLADLRALTHLDLSGNPVKDLSALAGLRKLRLVYLDKAQRATEMPILPTGASVLEGDD